MTVQFTNKKAGISLGNVEYGKSKYEVRNVGGNPHFYFDLSNELKKATGKRYGVTKGHVASGYMLRKLGIESNAGGGIFIHYTAPRKTVAGMNLSQIKAFQKKY